MLKHYGLLEDISYLVEKSKKKQNNTDCHWKSKKLLIQ